MSAIELLPFDREAPCPACGIALEIERVCAASHPDLPAPPGVTRLEHLHVACPGCGWSGYMAVASSQAADEA